MEYLVVYGKYKRGKVVEAHSPKQAIQDLAMTEMNLVDFLHEAQVFRLTPDGKFKVNSQIDVQEV